MARGRHTKRPTTPSESEDESSESETEESERETEDEELTLRVGAEAEVRSDDPGFAGSFYEVTVTGHKPSCGLCTVVYSTLVADDGGPLEETVAAADVRPRPPRQVRRRQFAANDAVEARYNEGWWAGVVSAVRPPVAGAPRVYQVAFPTSRETMDFEATALRPHRVFQAGRWVPAAEVEDGSPLFPKGTQVEVSFGDYWSPASVLKVIGATNYLVQYTHREDRKLAIEIIDSQYIRPARMEFAKLNPGKRPISSTMSLYKDVGTHRSSREKRLKNAEVESESTSPLFSLCNNESSSYPEGTVKLGNAVFAPTSLASMAGFACFSYSSLPESSHVEHASSQNITTHSAPVFGTFGQPRTLPQGPLLGMQPLTPQTPTERIAAESIEEARNTVSMSDDVANLEDGVDNGELGYVVTIGRGMISQINIANFVDPAMRPKDVGGSQHAASRQGVGSSMDDRLSESLAVEHLPFMKTSPIWAQIESMEIFSRRPQQPHFNQCRQYDPKLHEGMALGLMLSFANLAESINRLDVEDDIEGLFEGKMQGLSFLEANGFDVGALRSRLETLLHRKNSRSAEPRGDAMKTLEELIARKETDDRELGAQMSVLARALHHLRLYARLMRDMMRSAVRHKMDNAIEMSRLKAEANKIQRSCVPTAEASR